MGPDAVASKTARRQRTAIVARACALVLFVVAAEKLRNGPFDRPLKRFPHGWTKLSVTRTAGRWTIRYDALSFAVDVATGAVTR